MHDTGSPSRATVRSGGAARRCLDSPPGPGRITGAELGFYLAVRSTGFAVHMSASQKHLRFVREMADKTLTAAGIAAALTEDVQLVASELIGNSVRHCGDLVPLVVEIDTGPAGVSVKVHDPDGENLPRRAAMPGVGAAQAESGRGLPLVDLLAPGWVAAQTPTGKQISCHLPFER